MCFADPVCLCIYSGGMTHRQMIKPRLDLLYCFLLSVLCTLLHWCILKWNMTDVLNNEASIRTCNNCEQNTQSPWMLGFKQLFPNLSALWCQRGRIFLRPQSPWPTDELATSWQSQVTGKNVFPLTGCKQFHLVAFLWLLTQNPSCKSSSPIVCMEDADSKHLPTTLWDSVKR